MCIYTGFIMSLLTISVHEISGELRPVKTVSRDYYDDTTREVFGKQLEQLESVEDVEIVSKNAVAKLEAQVNNLPKGRYRPGDVGDSQHSAESNREYQIPSSKKTLCIFSPPKEYCVVQMKDISSSDPQEVILPRHAVVDDVAETGVADDDKVGVSDEDDGNTHNIKGG
ncbi:uncharacterized protein LOC134801946 isoform X5 [Cydia splendana]|uniref:uncharacterized protein LOC134801946 isoform X5 n=1 Tax=Cydia splendana TaxID=1100963 RepID=UPI00300C6851